MAPISPLLSRASSSKTILDDRDQRWIQLQSNRPWQYEIKRALSYFCGDRLR
jgi:hypothetical protein